MEAGGLHTGSDWVLLTLQGAGPDQRTDQSQVHMVGRKGGGCTGWAGVATSRRPSTIGKRVQQRQRGCSGERGGPRDCAVHPNAPVKPLQAAPSQVCGKLGPVNGGGEEPGPRPLEGTEQATFQ